MNTYANKIGVNFNIPLQQNNAKACAQNIAILFQNNTYFFLLYFKDISYHSFEFYNLHFDFVFLKMFNTVINSAEYFITYLYIRFYWPHNKP